MEIRKETIPMMIVFSQNLRRHDAAVVEQIEQVINALSD